VLSIISVKGLLVNILTRHILSLDRFLIIEHKVGKVKHVMSLLFNLFGGSWNQNIAISYGLSSLLLQSGLAWPGQIFPIERPKTAANHYLLNRPLHKMLMWKPCYTRVLYIYVRSVYVFAGQIGLCAIIYTHWFMIN
jgi:hypothetical protein